MVGEPRGDVNRPRAGGGSGMTEAELDQLNSFLSAYETYVQEQLKPAQTDVMAVLDRWRQPEHWRKYL